MTKETTGPGRWVIVLVVVIAVVGVLFLRAGERRDSVPEEAIGASAQTLPRLLDLGADKCVPCKMMAPILAELETELAGQCEVTFLDVWKNPDEAKKYDIKLIPTQIFFGPDGVELFRHEGFLGRDDILDTWKDLGYEFRLPAAEQG